MNVLITGINGFIGSRIAFKLFNEGYKIFGASRGNLNDNLKKIVSGYQSVDFMNPNFNLDLTSIDFIVHSAARVHILKENEIDAINSYLKVNSCSTEILARKASISGVKKFIFLSSIAVHGIESGDKPFSEKTPIGYIDAYGKSKYKAEKALLRACKNTKLNYTILRPPMVYGPGAPAHFHMLVSLIKKKLPLPLKYLNARRSFLYIENLCDFISFALKSEKVNNQIFLISDNEALTVPEIVKSLSRGLLVKTIMFPLPLKILKFAAFLVGKKKLYRRISSNCEVDSSYLRKVTGWSPPYDVKTGLCTTAKYSKEILNNKRILNTEILNIN